MVNPWSQLIVKESWNYGGGTDNMPRFFEGSAMNFEETSEQLKQLN